MWSFTTVLLFLQKWNAFLKNVKQWFKNVKQWFIKILYSIKLVPLKECLKGTEMMKRFCQISQVFDDDKNAISCDCCNIDEINKLSINRHRVLFILHLNIPSLSSHIDDQKIFLGLLTTKRTYVFLKADYLKTFQWLLI